MQTDIIMDQPGPLPDRLQLAARQQPELAAAIDRIENRLVQNYDWRLQKITLDAKESRRLKSFTEWAFEDELVEACRVDLVGNLLLSTPEKFVDYELENLPDCDNFAPTRNSKKGPGQLHQFASVFSRRRAF